MMCAALPSSSWCLRLERFGEFRISQVKLTCRYRRCGICIVFLSGRIVCRGSVSSRYTRKGEWSRGYVLGCLPSGVWRSRAEGEGLTRGGSPGVFYVQELHEALAGGGGGATFIMDDGYCYGRSEEVLPAICRFADRLTALGFHTCSSESVPSTRPALFRQRFGPSSTRSASRQVA